MNSYQRFVTIRDSIYNLGNAKKAITAEVNFEYEKKAALRKAEHEKKIVALEAQNQIHKNTRNYVVIISILVLVLLSVGFIYFNSKNNLKMQEAFSHQLIQSQEEERKRISRELHDSVGQNVLFLKNQLIKRNDETLLGSVNETLEEIRSISKDLYPNQLEKYGLIAAIDGLAEKTKEATGIFVSHDLEAVKDGLSSEKQISIYRIIQECISNAMKHAAPTALRITAEKNDENVQLVVQDNGRGFDKLELKRKAQKSFGILNIEERVKLIHGTSELETSPGNGTKWIFNFPK
jgi:signal transduction histidine kinase